VFINSTQLVKGIKVRIKSLMKRPKNHIYRGSAFKINYELLLAPTWPKHYIHVLLKSGLIASLNAAKTGAFRPVTIKTL